MVGSIGGQVYSWYGRFENTDGITVVLNSGAKTYTTTVDNYYFSFSNIPVGSYTITITDNRNLTYEGTRCAEMSMDFEMKADDDLGAEFTLPPKYSLQRGYLTSTIYGIKYPIINEQVIVKRHSDDSIWFVTVTDNSEHFYTPADSSSNEVYDVYARDKYVFSYGGISL